MDECSGGLPCFRQVFHLNKAQTIPQGVDDLEHIRADGKEKDRHKYRKLSAKRQRNLRRDRNKCIADEYSQINEFNSQDKSKELFRKVMLVQSKKYQPRQANIREVDGSVLTDPKDVLDRRKWLSV